MTKTEQLIERYFEATATAEEEEQLRHILADPATESTPAIDEARAVMGFTSLLRSRAPKKRRIMTSRVRAIASAAATIAIILGISLFYINGHHEPQADAAIYCQGEVNHSTEDALEIMRSQLGSIGQGIADGETSNILEALNDAFENE